MRWSRCTIAGGKGQEDGTGRRGELWGSWCGFVPLLWGSKFGKGPSQRARSGCFTLPVAPRLEVSLSKAQIPISQPRKRPR